MRIALTGTPGVGKTTLASLLRARGDHVVDLKQWAHDEGAIIGTDADGTKVLDVDHLDVETLPPNSFIEGHMAHHLRVDAVWLIRCSPAQLHGRLQKRDYGEAKIQENLEAEAMDLILQEAVAEHEIVVQRDGSNRDAVALLAAFDAAKTDTLKGHDLEAVDWSDWFMGDA